MRLVILLLVIAAACVPRPAKWAAGKPETRYTFFGFQGGGPDRFIVAGSDDGQAWKRLGGSWKGQINAPQALLSNGSYYFHVATASDGHMDCTSWQIGKADAAGVISTIATVDWAPKIPNLYSVFSGKWHVEGGVTHLFIPASAGDLAHFKVYETHALDGALTAWSDPLPVALDTPDAYDPAVWKIGATYFMWFTHDTTNHWVYLATASNLLGPYTTVRRGDWAGWGRMKEGPTMYSTGPNSWRLAVEDISSCYTFRGCGRNTMLYSDCANVDLLACAWTPLKPWTADVRYRHGNVIKNW